MRKSRAEELEEVKEGVRLLNEACAKGAIILVEGKRDKEALREAGVNGEVVTLFELVSRCSEFSETKIIIMLDLDSEGEEILKRIRRKYGTLFSVDDSIRAFIKTTKRYKRGFRTIEGFFRISP